MKSQALHTVWCNISVEDAGEIWNWPSLGANRFHEPVDSTKYSLAGQEAGLVAKRIVVNIANDFRSETIANSHWSKNKTVDVLTNHNSEAHHLY